MEQLRIKSQAGANADKGQLDLAPTHPARRYTQETGGFLNVPE
ncbi:MAG: hypothetical protein WBR26_03580 [Candidatus Acidiferrum sp.]